MSPPPLEDKAMDTGLESYRRIIRDVGTEEHVRVIETGTLIRDVTSKWTDGLHLSTASNRALAASLAGMIHISEGISKPK